MSSTLGLFTQLNEEKRRRTKVVGKKIKKQKPKFWNIQRQRMKEMSQFKMIITLKLTLSFMTA